MLLSCLGIIVSMVACSMWNTGFCQPILGPGLEIGPKDMTIRAGDPVKLICDLEDDNERTVLWFSSQTHSYISRNDEVRNPMLRDRFAVDVNYTAQSYTLLIEPVEESDAGTYGCLIASGLRTKLLASARLTVTPPPTSTPLCDITYLPHLSDSGSSQEMDISCSWQSNYTGVTVQLFENDTLIKPDIYLKGRVIRRLKVGDPPQSATYRCEISLSDFQWTSSCSVDSQQNPSVKVGISPLIRRTSFDSSVTLDCYAESRESIRDFVWKIPVNMSYHTLETPHFDDNFSSLEISGLDPNEKMVVVECIVLTEGGQSETGVAVVNVRPRYHPLKSSRVIISLLACLMFLLLISVIAVCRVCTRKEKPKPLSRKRLLARRGKSAATVYDTVAKYYQDGHLSMHFDTEMSVFPENGEDDEEVPTSSRTSHKRTGSFRSALYTKPLKLPKKLSRSNKSFRSSQKKSSRASAQTTKSGSESDVLYENLPRTGSISSMYSRFSTGSVSSGQGLNGNPSSHAHSAAENIYEADPIKHSYVDFNKRLRSQEHDDEEHDYQSIDDDSDHQSTSHEDSRPLNYAEIQVPKKMRKVKPKPKPKVKWADKGVVYTELDI